MLGVNIWIGFGADNFQDILLCNGKIRRSLEDNIYGGGGFTDKVVICWVVDRGQGEGKSVTEVAKKRISLIAMSKL